MEEAAVGGIGAAEAYNDEDGGRGEWFLEGDTAWEKFVDAGGRPWWWRERDLRRPIFGRKKIKAVFDDFAAAGMKKVMDIVAARKEYRGKFAMSTDVCQTKGRRKCSYLAVLLHYVDVDFQLKELCAGVLPIAGRLDWAFYGEKLQEILKRVGVELSDVLTVVSDHDAPLRKAIKTVLKLPAIGCQCDVLQLPERHMPPPLNLARKPCVPAPAPDPASHSSSSSESSSESSSSSSEEAAAEAPTDKVGATETYPKVRLTDPKGAGGEVADQPQAVALSVHPSHAMRHKC